MGYITKGDFLDPTNGPEYQALITGFDKNQLTPVGYDFRAGECINLTLGTKSNLPRGEKYPIHHGDFVIITTKEILRLGTRDDIFGTIYPKGSFAVQGLSQIGTKIDPGFEGPLFLAFKNEGYNIIEITEDTLVCNVALQIISSTGETYNRQIFSYPILSERPRLPFPLGQSDWEDHRLSRWYSREAFETYLQWSDELSRWIELTQGQAKELESSLSQRFDEESKGLRASLDKVTEDNKTDVKALEVKWEAFQKEMNSRVDEKLERADRIFIGAVVTLFVAAIAVVGVLISAGALFINELRLQVKGGAITIPTYTLVVVVILYALPLIALYKLLKGGKRQGQGSS